MHILRPLGQTRATNLPVPPAHCWPRPAGCVVGWLRFAARRSNSTIWTRAGSGRIVEFSVGRISDSDTSRRNQADNQPIQRNRFQLEFELFALVSPHEQSQITDAWDTSSGKDTRSRDSHLQEFLDRRAAGAGAWYVERSITGCARASIGRKGSAAVVGDGNCESGD